MTYDWRNHARREGPPQAERIPADGKEHRVRISRLVFGKQNGPAFVSKNGDPQFMVIFQDSEAREASLMITLNEKAGWVLARLMAACDPPINLTRMEVDGLGPTAFSDEEFANQQLVDRQLTILVNKGRDEKYPDVVPVIKRSDFGAETAKELAARGADVKSPATGEEPPPAEEAEDPPVVPTITNKQEVWSAICAAIPDKTKRNETWVKALRAIGKPEKEFGPEDWMKVVELSEVPF